jgi:hypothetical protein
LRELDIRKSPWRRDACFVAGRELTEGEWREVLPDQPFMTVWPG